MTRIFVLLFFLVGTAFTQPAKVGKTDATGQTWQVPFASSDNTITLSVQNNSGTEAKNISVAFNKIPSWLKFKESTATIKSISANASGDAVFTFSVDKKAPVGKDTTLTATISTTNGQSWTKEIKISVGAPKDYKLYNNFPNPFNPSTKIAFELPKASHVELIIYDVVGREVVEVADADYPAGYTELTWNGTSKNGAMVSSGVYFYRISTDKWSKVKKMLMLK
ncbi:MAG TPA: T9SS type A sorting domain-containing protein [Candidatus Acidoferrales bacterium]|nr:T9SS type A sorting domain-containing protein [Candidatus Acidoferrales bacterium]